jgi:16S rRNA G966 N2-methylase RsmD
MDYEEVLDYVGENAAGLLAPDGVVVVEHHKKKDLPKGFTELRCYRVLKQGDSSLSFYRAMKSVPSASAGGSSLQLNLHS